jgi:hypothetical protein
MVAPFGYVHRGAKSMSLQGAPGKPGRIFKALGDRTHGLPPPAIRFLFPDAVSPGRIKQA